MRERRVPYPAKPEDLTTEKISVLWKEFLEAHSYDVENMPDFFS
jgi:hypothetical protein